jgi:hypothetical protein
LHTLRITAVLVTLLAAHSAIAITMQPLTAAGTYARVGDPMFAIGDGGFVEEIDAFLHRAGAGTATRLSSDPAPDGLALAFVALPSADSSDLVLRYEVTNTDTMPVNGLSFLFFLDAEIDEARNTFFNEYGETNGTLSAGQSYEIDEPGFAFGDIIQNLLSGNLDDSNGVPVEAPNDVSMALALLVPTLGPGEIARFEFLISEDGDGIGEFQLVQRDADPASETRVTLSGALSIVPEPSVGILLGLGVGSLALSRRVAPSRAAKRQQ